MIALGLNSGAFQLDARLVQELEEYLAALQSGAQPTAQESLARYP